ncbi:MAG: enoyl-CoA hydratase-related protein [Caulobacteraceae bacterium]
MTGVTLTVDGPVSIVTLSRPERHNAVDLETAQALYAAFKAFDADETLAVAVLTGAGGHFCAAIGWRGPATSHPWAPPALS